METHSLYVHIPFCESICRYCDFCKVYYDQKQSDLYLQRLNEELSEKVKSDVFFEIIFMTYSFVHTKINEEAFPNAINLYNKDLMTGRGKGKYMYKIGIRKDGENFLREQMKKYFPNNEIMYIV